MGTNFYALRRLTAEERMDEDIQRMIASLRTEEPDIDEGFTVQGDELLRSIHIGKSSAGWEFTWDHNNWQYFEDTVASFLRFLHSAEMIISEYGEPYTVRQLLVLFESKIGGLNSLRYKEKWDEMHPNHRRPDYMFKPEYGDIYVGRFCFSIYTNFC